MDEENVLPIEDPYHTELVNVLHRQHIDEIRDNNNPNITKLVLSPREITPGRLSEIACRLLGRYIANNTHLINLTLPSNMDLNIFQGLTKSDSIKVLIFESVARNTFGVDGVQRLVPFLQNSPQLIKIDLSKNGIGSQGFGLGFESVVNALDGGSINELILNNCYITDISALGSVTLPHLKKISLCNNNSRNIHNIGDISSYTSLESLNLSHNSIGIDGCRAIAHLLQKEDTNLTTLHLDYNGIGDEGIEVLTNSLKHNKKLKSFSLKGNNLQAMGYLAILKLLVDVSSIENTYNNSNNTLKTLDFDINPPIRSDERIVKKMKALKKFITVFTTINNRPNPRRFKVVYAQLISQHRKGLCQIQGIDYSYESIFSKIDALVLPEVLSFVARHHKQTELFRMLVTVAPDLSSIVNRPVFFKERIVENEAKVVALGIKYEREVAALNAEKLEMKRELEALQSGEKTKDKEVQEDKKLSGKKRNRS